jgi:hypothetical protein
MLDASLNSLWAAALNFCKKDGNIVISYAKAGVGKTADEMSFSLDTEF